MLKKIACIMIMCLVYNSIAFTGCGVQNDETKGGETRIITDLAGDEVEIPVKIERVVNLCGFGSQIMIALGLDEYLIGISDETIESPWITEMYPEIADIPTYSYETSAETLLAINPDVVMCDDREICRELRSKGVPAVTIMYYSIDDFKKDIELLGEILGDDAKEKCDKYLVYLDEKIMEVDEALKDVVTDRKSMYYINGTADRGLYKTNGAGSTNEAVAKLAYVDFATSDLLKSPESKVDAEAILAKNPETIIIGGRYQHVLYEEIYEATEWSNVEAIKKQQVYKVPIGLAAWNRYSIELALMIPWMASVIYPEYYEFDAVNETIEFYRMFTGYELTEQQAEYIIGGLMTNGEKEIPSR